MKTRYFVQTDPTTGKFLVGTTVMVPEQYTQECDVSIWDNSGRAFYENGAWKVYDELTLVIGAETVEPNRTITATATVPLGSKDATVTFWVDYTDESGAQHTIDPVTAPTDGVKASQTFLFETEGIYRISASSYHHGTKVGQVTVNAVQ